MAKLKLTSGEISFNTGTDTLQINPLNPLMSVQVLTSGSGTITFKNTIGYSDTDFSTWADATDPNGDTITLDFASDVEALQNISAIPNGIIIGLDFGSYSGDVVVKVATR